MNETRTRDPDLGKVVLYQLSYHRIVAPLRKSKITALFPKAGAKVLLFFDLTKFFSGKMQKKCIFSSLCAFFYVILHFLWLKQINKNSKNSFGKF